ncbi:MULTISPECIES: hypothetical protein [Achromobacter]|uniref:hypothetical protein n=1 Tax=Alcaligenes xylosoxydans xylosoxydans TaxID=85698 RepID=UPI0011D1EB7A|nr:hypothetical protein [Achromobacter xylosoxidans]
MSSRPLAEVLDLRDQLAHKKACKVCMSPPVQRRLALTPAGNARKILRQDSIAVFRTAPKVRQTKRQHETGKVQFSPLPITLPHQRVHNGAPQAVRFAHRRVAALL